MQESFTPSQIVTGGAIPYGAQKDSNHVGKKQKY
jgi:hypothetical protein